MSPGRRSACDKVYDDVNICCYMAIVCGSAIIFAGCAHHHQAHEGPPPEFFTLTRSNPEGGGVRLLSIDRATKHVKVLLGPALYEADVGKRFENKESGRQLEIFLESVDVKKHSALIKAGLEDVCYMP